MSFSNTITQYSFPTLIDYGVGARKNLASVLSKYKLKRPLIVTDKDFAKLDILVNFVNFLSEQGLSPGIFDQVIGNPTQSQVTQGVAAYRQLNTDCVVAVGGGASIDVAKAIALMVTHAGDLFDYAEDAKNIKPITEKLPFLAALPTTAGTGSEVGRSTVISADKTHIKKIIFSPHLLPKHVFVDPEFTLKLPLKITAATGMDALTHLIEAYISKGFNPMCDGIALEGLRLVATNLKVCCENTKHLDRLDTIDQFELQSLLETRGNMMIAALMGAVAFQKGLGITHSCAHALSTVCDMHHGLANGIMLPFALEFNTSIVPQKFRDIAWACGQPENKMLNWLHELKVAIGIPGTLLEAGVTVNNLDSLVNVALADGCHLLNPRPVSRTDFIHVFKNAFGE